MAASITNPVTIDRAYFETLVRRANYNNDGLGAMPFATNEETIVPVPKEEYKSLLLLSRQFANLKRSLMGAGVTEENIAILVQDAHIEPYADFTPAYNHDQSSGLEECSKQAAYPTTPFQTTSYSTYGPTSNGTPRSISYFNNGLKPSAFQESHDWTSHEHTGGTFTPSYSADGPTDIHTESSYHKPQLLYARMCKRTIALCGLPPFTTLGDVTSVVRGGQLLDVFLRSAEHIASVSFVHEDDAVQFYEHARKNDIYIKNKRGHFHSMGRPSFYSSRARREQDCLRRYQKLVAVIIRRCGAHHTEDSVREDLEHIHNLIVVGVEFVGGSCYIKTNSVHNAMFARTCMMSRAKYKGSKIEWDVDECDKPLEVTQKTSIKSLPQRVHSTKAHSANTRNRFDMLRLDDDDNRGSDDKFDTSSEMPSTVNVAA